MPRSRAIDDKYSRREEYRGFTQDFKEKDGYKPDVKIEYVDETGRKLTPKEVRGPLRRGPGDATGSRLSWPLAGGPGEVLEPCASVSFSLVGTAVSLMPGRRVRQVPQFLCSPAPSVA